MRRSYASENCSLRQRQVATEEETKGVEDAPSVAVSKTPPAIRTSLFLGHTARARHHPIASQTNICIKYNVSLHRARDAGHTTWTALTFTSSAEDIANCWRDIAFAMASQSSHCMVYDGARSPIALSLLRIVKSVFMYASVKPRNTHVDA